MDCVNKINVGLFLLLLALPTVFSLISNNYVRGPEQKHDSQERTNSNNNYYNKEVIDYPVVIILSTSNLLHGGEKQI